MSGKSMTSRERVSTVLAGGVPDRVPLSDIYWSTTVERWLREGLSPGVDPNEYFGTDEIIFVSGDYSMQFPERTVEVNERTRTYWDREGALKRDLVTPDGWTPQWLDFAIKSHEDWQRHKGRLAFHPSRITETTLERYRRAEAADRFICYSAHGCFHSTWMRVGMENQMMMMLDDPSFMDELFAAHTRLVIDIFEGFLSQGVRFDGVRIADDLGYRSATLISPKLYRELVSPHHRRLCEHFAARGLPTLLHSDGNIAALIPQFIDVGFRGLHPLEVKAGLDLRDVREEYGDRLVIYGNIDARKLAGTKEEIEEEITTKLAVARESAGYIYHSDHSVPKDVPLRNYRWAIELLLKHGSYE